VRMHPPMSACRKGDVVQGKGMDVCMEGCPPMGRCMEGHIQLGHSVWVWMGG
jgi:hypothetical protein